MTTQNPDRAVDDLESVQENKEKKIDEELPDYENPNADPFGNEEFSEVKYKVMSWW